MPVPTPSIGVQAPKRKSPSWGLLIAFVLLGMVLAFAAATQYTAYQYAYDPALGEPLIGLIYEPWAFISWSLQWGNTDPDLYQTAYLVAGSALVTVFAFYAIAVALTRRRTTANDSLHGTARWASREDIQEAGLLPAKGKKADGVFVGGYVENKMIQYLRHDGPEHILGFAPTRSGKGVGLVIPTLLSWLHSVVVFDMKGENWALTAGWRKATGQRVLRFDPSDASGTGARFNPLQEIRLGSPHEVGDAQGLATIMADPEGKGLNDHWMKTGHALLVGVILHCLYKKRSEGRVATLTDLSYFLSDPARTLHDSLQEMVHFDHTSDGTHPIVAQSARDMLNREERELSSVHSTAVSYLTLYRDPVITRNTEESDFRIDDLMNHEDPVSLYIVVKPADLPRLRPLVRLIFTQIIQKLTDHMEFEGGRSVAHYKHRLLLLLDEFPSLGRLEVVEQSLAFLAGYGIKAYLIVQDLAQLHKAYTKDEAVVSACHVRVAYAPNKIETAELLSRMTGKTTVIKKSVSVSGGRFGAVLDRATENLQEVERPLLTADECMRLPGPKKSSDGGEILEPGDMLIMPSGFNAVYGKQVLYFKDPVLSKRSMLAAPIESDRISAQAGSAGADNRPASELEALFD